MTYKHKLKNILFLDIETVPQYKEYDELPESLKKLWNKKALFLKKDDQSAEDVYQKAGIYAEFGKIICISFGIIIGNRNNFKLKIKSIYNNNEFEILSEFKQILISLQKKRQFLLCAHNGKEFDFPYISRRMLVNNIKLPRILDIAGKKPWEVKHLDTLELWKFGDYKHYTSLELLCEIFGINTPKDDISGADVWRIYWLDNDLERIKDYCEKDVFALSSLYLKYRGIDISDFGYDISN